LLLSQFDSACTPPSERQLGLTVAAGGALLALALLLVSPPLAAALELPTASAQLGPSLARLRGRTGVAEPPRGADAALDGFGAAAAAAVAAGMEGGDDDVSHLLHVAWLALPLSLVAGVLSGALAAPGVRWARCFLGATQPPPFSAALCGASPAGALAARVAFVLTAASAAAVASAAARREARAPPALPALLLAAAAAHAAALRPMAQAYLDSALVAWYELRHAAGVDATIALSVMNAKFEATSRLLCKVALQLAAPAALALAAAAVLLAKREGAGAGAADAVAAADAAAALPASLWRAAAAFLGAWACASWALAAAAALAFFRTGLAKP
jgi:hypothetical protein